MKRFPRALRIGMLGLAALALAGYAVAYGLSQRMLHRTTPPCPDEDAIATYVADYHARRVSRGFGDSLSLAEAECAKRAVILELTRAMGSVVGYKAGFTNRAAQERNGLAAPAWGAMFAHSLVASRARLSADFGARPHFEPDLVVIVKDAGLADATTPLEALRHIDAIVPFIELPDLMLAETPRGTAAIAINIGFRGGVLGSRIEVQPTEDFLEALGTMMVVMTDEVSGAELGRSEGSLLMGHPIRAAMWLAQTLRDDGIPLRPGDLLSLGAFIPPAPVRAGTAITVRYLGLPADPSVSVSFR